MQHNKGTDTAAFAALPISILKDSYENGKKESLICCDDAFHPFHRTVLKSVTDVLSTEYTFTEYHYHDGVELILIDSGEASVIVNNRTVRVQKGDILVINMFEPHGIFLESTEAKLTRSCITFRPYYLFPPENADDGTHFFADLRNILFQTHIPASHPAASRISECVTQILTLCERRNAGWSVEVFSRLLIFYSIVIGHGLFSKNEGNTSYMFDFMTKVNNYIEKNLDQDITTTDIAAFCQYSTEHFCRLFKKCFNKTFKDYLNVYRIRKAKEFIERGEFNTIAEVSSRFGFNNQNHFGHMFKKYVGILPSEYINRQKTGKTT